MKRGRSPCRPDLYAGHLPIARVDGRTPPTFLFHTAADELVSADGTLRFALALRRAKVPFELHVFAEGAHGVGLGAADPALSRWPDLLQEWMRARRLL